VVELSKPSTTCLSGWRRSSTSDAERCSAGGRTQAGRLRAHDEVGQTLTECCSCRAGRRRGPGTAARSLTEAQAHLPWTRSAGSRELRPSPSTRADERPERARPWLR
jgi:hypothetical protein